MSACTNDCTVDCGRCKGQPYFVKKVGTYWFVMWRESRRPAASFYGGDFNDAKERAQVVANELNEVSR